MAQCLLIWLAKRTLEEGRYSVIKKKVGLKTVFLDTRVTLLANELFICQVQFKTNA